MTELAPTTMTTSSETPPTSAPPEEIGWQRLAEDILATWTEALRELTLLLEELPDPSAVEPQVRALRETYVRELVELGRARETFGASDRASVDSRLRSGLNAMGDDVAYQTYSDTYNAYLEMDAGLDFYNLMASFNILTQYADFRLLKMQEPEEAARLGIE